MRVQRQLIELQRMGHSAAKGGHFVAMRSHWAAQEGICATMNQKTEAESSQKLSAYFLSTVSLLMLPQILRLNNALFRNNSRNVFRRCYIKSRI